MGRFYDEQGRKKPGRGTELRALRRAMNADAKAGGNWTKPRGAAMGGATNGSLARPGSRGRWVRPRFTHE
jgi:hypothetical protein